MGSNRDSLEPECDASVTCLRSLWTEEDFLARLLERADAAWDQVKACYGPYLYRKAMYQLANHADAEDVVQESFLGFMTQFRKGDVHNPHAMFTQIFLNKITDVIRERQSQRKHTTPLSPDCDPPARDEKADEHPKLGDLHRAVERLCEPMRELYRKLYVEELSEHDIASDFGIAVTAVHARTYRMREAIREGMALTATSD